MSCQHIVRFTVEAAHWDTMERYAANRIRTYTREVKRGPDARSDEDVLRNAVFTVSPVDGSNSLWRAEVEVAV
jgi:hypothetical protein